MSTPKIPEPDDIQGQLRRLVEEAKETGRRAAEASARSGVKVNHFPGKPDLTEAVLHDLRDDIEGISLADAIRSLQEQLSSTQATTVDEHGEVVVSPVSVTIGIGIGNARAGGRARIWVSSVAGGLDGLLGHGVPLHTMTVFFGTHSAQAGKLATKQDVGEEREL
jgi:hypothetical protein